MNKLLPYFYCGAGHTCFAIGWVGAFVPIIPTVPLWLLALGFYAKGSPRFQAMILENKTFGPHIKLYQEHKAIKTRSKIMAIALLAASITWSISIAPLLPVKILLAVIGISVSIFIITRPSQVKDNKFLEVKFDEVK